MTAGGTGPQSSPAGIITAAAFAHLHAAPVHGQDPHTALHAEDGGPSKGDAHLLILACGASIDAYKKGFKGWTVAGLCP